MGKPAHKRRMPPIFTCFMAQSIGPLNGISPVTGAGFILWTCVFTKSKGDKLKAEAAKPAMASAEHLDASRAPCTLEHLLGLGVEGNHAEV